MSTLLRIYCISYTALQLWLKPSPYFTLHVLVQVWQTYINYSLDQPLGVSQFRRMEQNKPICTIHPPGVQAPGYIKSTSCIHTLPLWGWWIIWKYHDSGTVPESLGIKLAFMFNMRYGLSIWQFNRVNWKCKNMFTFLKWMNRLAVGRSARAQQAHKVDNRIDQLHKIDNRFDRLMDVYLNWL